MTLANGNGRHAIGNGRAPLFAAPAELPPRLESLIEAILFVAEGPVAVADLGKALDVSKAEIEAALGALGKGLAERGLRLQRAEGRVQLVSAPETALAIQRFLGLETSARLSGAALETLAIIAYQQPVTRPEIEALRGVQCDGVMRTLQARGLVEESGRRETVGHPAEYRTTFLFLEYFGLSSLEDLPPVDEFPRRDPGLPTEEA